MSVFITGATGFLGGYVLNELLRRGNAVSVLVRAAHEDAAREKLWQALQPCMAPPAFWECMERVDFVFGDLCQPDLGLAPGQIKRICRNTTSIIHLAASLNRRSARRCFDANLRGTLSVIRLARTVATQGNLRRFSHVSTTAVAGERAGETIDEAASIDWNRRDYDPYARTKKFAEHMVYELLSDVPVTVFRPSTVIGDAQKPGTRAFDMARAFCSLARLPVIPMARSHRQDVVNVDWVARAMVALHEHPAPTHRCYHLSSGRNSCTAEELTEQVAHYIGGRAPRFVPSLEALAGSSISAAQSAPLPPAWSHLTSLLKVFWPYLTNDTVFDNGRVVSEVKESPVPFVDYCGPLYRWVVDHHFAYPYAPMPSRPVKVAVA